MGTVCPTVAENVLISEIEMELSFRGCCGMRRRTRPHREGSPLNICAVPLSASSVAARMELELGRMENRVDLEWEPEAAGPLASKDQV